MQALFQQKLALERRRVTAQGFDLPYTGLVESEITFIIDDPPESIHDTELALALPQNR
jgi:hypothetical protein